MAAVFKAPKPLDAAEMLLKTLNLTGLADVSALLGAYEIIKTVLGDEALPEPANQQDFLPYAFRLQPQLSTDERERLQLLFQDVDWQTINVVSAEWNADVVYNRLLEQVRRKDSSANEAQALLERHLRPAVDFLMAYPAFQAYQAHYQRLDLRAQLKQVLHLLNQILIAHNSAISNHIPCTAPVAALSGQPDSLRGCLNPEQQPYINPENPSSPDAADFVAKMLAHLIPENGAACKGYHLILKGAGGLGKTRLALEICRLAESRHQALVLLIRRGVRTDDVRRLMRHVAAQGQHLILLIDYIEEFVGGKKDGGDFDSLYRLIETESGGYTHLLITTRHLPCENLGFLELKSNEKSGECLAEPYFRIVDLNGDDYEQWRIALCTRIFPDAADMRLDNPLIATLLAYDQRQNGRQYLDTYRHHDEDGRWLLRRLTRDLPDFQERQIGELVLMLLLFPFDNIEERRIEAAFPHWRDWWDALLQNGLLSCVRYEAPLYEDTPLYERGSTRMQWQLGHDLLADISLTQFLLSQSAKPPVLRQRLLQKLVEQAKELDLTDRMMRSLSRAVRRAVGHCKVGEALDMLAAFGRTMLPERLAELGDYPVEAESLIEDLLCSFSLNLFGRIRVIEELPEFLEVQFIQLKEVFAEEIDKFKSLIIECPDVICVLLLVNALNSSYWFQAACIKLGITDWRFLPLLSETTHCYLLSAYQLEDISRSIQNINLDFSRYGIFNQKVLPFCSEQERLGLVKITFEGALELAEQGDLSGYGKVVTQFGGDTCDEVRLQAAKAAFNYALELAKQGDLSGYGKVVTQFGGDTCDEVRLQAAKAAFSYANDIAKQGDLSGYGKVVEQFGGDACDEVRLQAAQAAFNYALELAKQGDLSGYGKVVEQFGGDACDEVRLQAAKAAFNYALELADELAKQGDLSGYGKVVAQFGGDTCDEVRLWAANVAFNYAFELAKQGDLSGYGKVVEQFGSDTCDEVRLHAANAAFNYAFELAEQGDWSGYGKVEEQFGGDTCDEVRLQAAKAALNYALALAEQNINPDAFLPFIGGAFADDGYRPIQKQIFLAKTNRIGFLVVRRQSAAARAEAATALSDDLCSKEDAAVLYFLLWLDNPCVSNRVNCSHAIAQIGSKGTDWTFDEFAGLIAALPPGEQRYARHKIALLERHG